MGVRIICFVLLLTTILETREECLSRDYGNSGTVCVCNSEQCDTIPRPLKLEEPQYYVYTSNQAGLRFNQEVGEFSDTEAITNHIEINRDLKYQEVLGFGGAFTDSVGINIATLNDDLQEKLLRSYFAEDGIEYNLCRVPIGGTDFSTHGYSYNDGDVDEDLTNFALAEEDYKYKIPYIKKALELTDNNVEFFASAWTAPKWMKTNGEYGGTGFLKEEFYQTWVDYYVKFLDSYRDEGIEFWGITTGNEPHNYIINSTLNSVGWLPHTMGDWIQNNLGPTLKNSEYSDINIMILDDARIFLPWFVVWALSDNSTREYIDGVAVHWYFDSFTSPSLLTDTHKRFPEKFILSTEACVGTFPDQQSVVLGSWERGELYSADIIEDFLNWVGGWIDWNMALDETGGPNYLDGFYDSPIIVNATAGEFYKQPMFYHLGHFSKFVPKGSVRIDLQTNFYREDVLSVGFQTPDDSTVVVILNREEEVVPFTLVDSTKGTAQLVLSEKSITTILYW